MRMVVQLDDGLYKWINGCTEVLLDGDGGWTYSWRNDARMDVGNVGGLNG